MFFFLRGGIIIMLHRLNPDRTLLHTLRRRDKKPTDTQA